MSKLFSIFQTGGTAEVQTLTGNSGGAVGPTDGNINIIGSGGVTVAGNSGTSTLTISVAGGGFSWSDKSTSFVATAGNGYFILASLTATLPASPTEGDTVSFVVDSSSTLIIQTNTGQFIRFNGSITGTPGTGTLTSGAIGDVASLVYRSTLWTVLYANSGTQWTLSD